jgi:HEAT repeat protein
VLLRRFVPKNAPRPGEEGRAAAIWALGQIHEGKADDALSKALEARLNDTTSMPPEDSRVRMMCALTLGRMKAKESLASLRRYFTAREPSLDLVNNACGWAVGQITGEPMPPARPIVRMTRDWFLVPN